VVVVQVPQVVVLVVQAAAVQEVRELLLREL
jgi:hypothetical protein